jgi:hypothetical protein
MLVTMNCYEFQTGKSTQPSIKGVQMPENTAVAYLISVRSKGSKESSITLGSIARGKSFCDIFEDFLNESQIPEIDDNSLEEPQPLKQNFEEESPDRNARRIQRGWILEDKNRISQTEIDGIYKTTVYGYGNDIIDVVTGKKIGELQTTQGVSVPLYFRLCAESDAPRGVLVLHRDGLLTAYPELITRFLSWFRVQFNKLYLEMNPVTSGAALAAYLEGSKLSQFKLRKYSAASNPEDSLRPYRVGAYTLVFDPPRGQFFLTAKFLGIIRQKGRLDPEDIIEVLQEEDRNLANSFKPEELTIEIQDKDGRNRTLNFSKDTFREIFYPRFPISYDNKGFMQKACFDIEAKFIIKDVLAKFQRKDEDND